MSAELRRQVILRAEDKCEYCLTPQHLASKTFHVDHIISNKQEGESNLENLCLACSVCNINKGASIVAYFKLDRTTELLFNPRVQKWRNHFQLLSTGQIFPLTRIAEGTIRVLQLNDEDRILERHFGIQLGEFIVTG